MSEASGAGRRGRAVPPSPEDGGGEGAGSLKQVSSRTRLREAMLKNLFLACACVAVLAVVLIFVFTVWKALPVLTDIGLPAFFGPVWAPTDGRYGILALLAGSGIVTVGSLIIGVPLAVGCAVFLTEIAGRRLAGFVGAAVDLLAGVPSVVFGFFGLVVLRPIVARVTGGLGFGALTVWLVLAIMIMPTITTLTMDALNSIPMGIREASFAMGATRWQTIYKVVLPAAKTGIVNAVVLGMGRAIGETMAVLMVVGNAPVVPATWASPLSTLTSQIALDMGYSSGLHRSALFGMGVVLFVISASLVGIVRALSSAREGGRGRSRRRRAKAADRAVPAVGVSFDQAEPPTRHAPTSPLPADAVVPLTGTVAEPPEGSRAHIKRLLANADGRAAHKTQVNDAMLMVFRAAGLVVAVALALIIVFVTVNGLPQLSLNFVFGWPHGVNAEGGVFPTIVSTLYVTALSMLICVPVAVLAAVYLAEYATQGRLVTFVRYAADTLSSVPSIVMGLFGYALFVEAMGLGLSMLSAALSLALMMLPIVMRTTEEAIRSVPRYIRWGAYGLGATKWQVVSRIVLPAAFPRIATGVVLAIGRAVGETAVVLYTMGQAINLPVTPLDSGRPMTIHLYQLANEGINMQAAYGTALLLLLMILAFNLFARHLSHRSAARLKGN